VTRWFSNRSHFVAAQRYILHLFLKWNILFLCSNTMEIAGDILVCNSIQLKFVQVHLKMKMYQSPNVKDSIEVLRRIIKLDIESICSSVYYRVKLKNMTDDKRYTSVLVFSKST
jgi:hypothetical protein